ncbi:hypothetical protein YB2330_006369 [Saitoella coloradoensis]
METLSTNMRNSLDEFGCTDSDNYSYADSFLGDIPFEAPIANPTEAGGADDYAPITTLEPSSPSPPASPIHLLPQLPPKPMPRGPIPPPPQKKVAKKSTNRLLSEQRLAVDELHRAGSLRGPGRVCIEYDGHRGLENFAPGSPLASEYSTTSASIGPAAAAFTFPAPPPPNGGGGGGRQGYGHGQLERRPQSLKPDGWFERSTPNMHIRRDLERDAIALVSRAVFAEVLSDKKAREGFRKYLLSKGRERLLDFWLEAERHKLATEYINALSSSLLSYGQQSSTTIEHHKRSSTASGVLTSAFAGEREKVFNEMYLRDFGQYVRDRVVCFARNELSRRLGEFDGAPVRRRLEGLGECYCLTNPRRLDNPIVMTSEAFVEVTGYARQDIINKNCRFLQGPATNPASVRRIRVGLQEGGSSIVELLLNYRKDGVPFFNLLFMAPLRDQKTGEIDYFLGAQINVTSTVWEASRHSLFFLEDEGMGEDDDEEEEEEEEELDETGWSLLAARRLRDLLPRKRRVKKEKQKQKQASKKSLRDDGDSSSDESSSSSDSDTSDDDDLKVKRTKARLAMPQWDRYEEHNRNSVDSSTSLRELETAMDDLRRTFNKFVLISASYHITHLSDAVLSSSDMPPSSIGKHWITDVVALNTPRYIVQGLMTAMEAGRPVSAQVRDLEGDLRWVHCTPLVGFEGRVESWVVLSVGKDRAGQ